MPSDIGQTAGVPVALRGALQLPLMDQAAPVPIPNDGRAAVLSLSVAPDAAQFQIVVDFVYPFNQLIPRPFCSTGPLDFLRVVGPLRMVHRVHTNPSERYEATSTASGTLQVTPTNPLTGAIGGSFEATIAETHRSSLTDRRSEAQHVVSQVLGSAPQQSFFEDFWAGHSDRLMQLTDCGG